MSDLNLRSGLPAWMRLNGIWRKVTQRPITTDELLAALERLTKNNSVSALIKSGQSDYDFAHEIEESRGVRRWRTAIQPASKSSSAPFLPCRPHWKT